MAAGDLRPQTSENAGGVKSLLDSLAMLVVLDVSSSGSILYDLRNIFYERE